MMTTTSALGSAQAQEFLGKRDKKTQALNALLSASALGLFLEGCGGTGDTAGDNAGGTGDSSNNGSNNGSDSSGLLLVATAEPDTHTGGAGSDTVSYADSDAPVTVSLSSNTGTGGDAEGDTFESIENLIGSDDDDFLTGDANPNTLEGGAGNDALNGGAGSDTVSYADSDASVEVDLSTGLASGGDAEGDTFESIENLIGSDYDDDLIGDDNPNTLDGGAGNDVLNGGAGDDNLEGGEGSDALNGGADNDILRGGAGNDGLFGNAGDDTLNGGAGYDNLDGGAGNDTLNGGAGNDILNGGAGNDILDGGGGTDTYQFRKNDGGSDTIHDVAGDTMNLRFFGYQNDDFEPSSFTRTEDDLQIDLGTNTIRIVDAYDDDSTTGTDNTAFTINIQYYADGQYTDVTGLEAVYTL